MKNFTQFINEGLFLKSFALNEKESPILKAAKDGDYNNVKMYLDDGENPNAYTKAGKTPMMFAALNGDVKMGKLLKEEGGEINASDSKGITVLMTAAKAGKTEFVDWLIKEKVALDVRCSDKYMPTALAAAVYNKRGPVIELLLKAGADKNVTINGNDILLGAIYMENSAKTIKMMIDNGVSDYNMIHVFYKEKALKDLAYKQFEEGNCSSTAAFEFIRGNNQEDIPAKLGLYSSAVKDSYFTDKVLSKAIKQYGLERNKSLWQYLVDTGYDEPAALIAPNIEFSDDEVLKILKDYNNNIRNFKTLKLKVQNTAKFKKYLCDSCMYGYDNVVEYLIDEGVTLDGISDSDLSTLETIRLEYKSNVIKLRDLLVKAGLDEKMRASTIRRREKVGKIGSSTFEWIDFL